MTLKARKFPDELRNRLGLGSIRNCIQRGEVDERLGVKLYKAILDG